MDDEEEVPAEASTVRRPERQAATTAEAREVDDSSPVRLVQKAVRTRMNEIADLRSRVMLGDAEAKKDMQKRLRDFAKLMDEVRSHSDSEIRNLMQTGFVDDITAAHGNFLKEGENLPESFVDENKRVAFRRHVFNELCAAGLFGLSIKDMQTDNDMQRGPRVKAFYQLAKQKYELAKQKLGKNLQTFEKICDQYDGHNFRESMEDLVDSEYVGRRASRLRERVDIGRDSLKRNQQELAGDAPQTKGRRYLLGFLREGGDIALKAAGVGLMIYGSGFVAAAGAGLYAAKGISEAMGYDFGQVVLKGVKRAKDGAKTSGKELLNMASEKWKDEMDPDLLRWLERAPATSPERLERASLGLKTRAKLFGRGLLPSAIWSFSNDAKADAPQNHIAEQTDTAEQKLHEICVKVVGKFASVKSNPAPKEKSKTTPESPSIEAPSAPQIKKAV